MGGAEKLRNGEENYGPENYKKTSSYKRANILSKWFFCWMFPTFVRGSKRDLNEGDLREPRNKHVSHRLGDSLEVTWFAELREASAQGRQPSYAKALIKAYWKKLIPSGIITLITALLRSYQPVLLASLLEHFNEGSEVSQDTAMWYGIAVITVALVSALMWHHANLLLQEFGMNIRIASSSLMYRKIMRMSNSSLGETAAGKLANLLSNDVNRFDLAFMFIHYIWVTPMQIVFMGYFMYQQAGTSSLIGIAAIVILTLPIQGSLTKLIGKYREKISTRTDRRVKVMNEIITGIQVIKMYAWEKPFDKVVSLARAMEIKYLIKAGYLKGFFLSFLVFTERTALFLTVLTYTLLGFQINASVVYPLAQFFNAMQIALAIHLPMAVVFLAETKVSVKRIEEFLIQDERRDLAILQSSTIDKTPSNTLEGVTSNMTYEKTGSSGNVNFGFMEDHQERLDSLPVEDAAIEIREVSARWSNDLPTPSLNNISIRIRKNKLCAVIGSVGAGKSTLLELLLKELQPERGSITIDGSISYASQEPWLYVATVRENILFGLPYDQDKYKDVCRVCCLEKDFQQFPHGDQTLVGERGVSLSGGQRARVNLARAVYREADIYLLDDPLSAVDAHVGRDLFDSCISGFLRHKTRVLVTHQLHYLQAADFIVVLNNGSVETMGTYEELVNSAKDFTLMLSALQEEKDKEQDTDVISRSVGKESNRESDIGKRSVTSELEADRNTDGPQRMDAETRASGGLKWKVVSSYFGAAGGVFTVGFTIFMMLVGQFSASVIDYWLTYWVNQISQHESTPAAANTTELDLHEQVGILTTIQYIYVYAALVVSCILLVNFRVVVFTRVCMRASTELHNRMFSKMMRGVMRFFDTSSSGRILNRFSKDVGAMDEMLPRTILDAAQIYLVLISILSLNAVALVWTLIPTAVMIIFFLTIKFIYLRTAQAIRRLEGTTKSPVFSQVTSTLDGISTIRAASAEKRLIHEFDAVQDFHTAAFNGYLAGGSTLGFWLDFLCAVYLALIIFIFLFIDFGDLIPPGNVGLAISQSMVLTTMLQIGVRSAAEMLSQMTSVERVLEYTNIEPEKNLEQGVIETPKHWPATGEVKFKNVFLKYGPNEPYVLKDLNIVIKSGWRVGIVGRTGAGKSTLISALFRLANVIEGDIIIDGVNTEQLAKTVLRSNISIIPQEPVLFSATLRYNLDPFNLHSDDEIWKALDAVDLKQAVPALDFRVSEGGANFSLGQRQLVCLARAILRSNKVLVLDEATANVDPRTDALIQETIRRSFSGCTVLTVAHRLNTIMDSDRVLVMAGGQVVEFDSPHALLSDEASQLAALVRETGSTMAEQLRRMAEETFKTTEEAITAVHGDPGRQDDKKLK